jgi:hypothetical protein
MNVNPAPQSLSYNSALVDKIVNAVLYEGYILYPYRPGSKKNRTRFTFGRVYPEAYSVSQRGAEPFAMQTECLVRAQVGAPALEVAVRFLQPVARDAGVLPAALPSPDLPDHCEPELVPELRVDDKRYQSWQEAIERQVSLPAQDLRTLATRPQTLAFSFAASQTHEPIYDSRKQVAGVIVRRHAGLSGVVETTAEPVDAEVFKVRVSIANRTPLAPSGLDDQDAVLMRTFASTHTILCVSGGDFLSMTDPPAAYADAAGRCKNVGTWPALVGQKGETGTMLSSPIILYDYPEIAPESPGDLCDGTEIDEILTLRIMTLTDAEKNEMRHVDEYARRILERTEMLGRDEFLKMHGVMRDAAGFGEDFFNPPTRLESISIGGIRLSKGDRVRIRPKGRADVMDLALAGKVAVIEAVEQDAENRVHLALVLDDDPGKDLGMLRQPGHRFFFAPDEVEPVRGEG